MKIYRYEYPGGGGPFVKSDGTLHFGSKMKIKPLVPGTIYGCSSLEKLKQYFETQEWVLENCFLKIYDVPQNNIIYQTAHEILFIPHI